MNIALRIDFLFTEQRADTADAIIGRLDELLSDKR